jgi:hypothetical protein
MRILGQSSITPSDTERFSGGRMSLKLKISTPLIVLGSTVLLSFGCSHQEAELPPPTFIQANQEPSLQSLTAAQITEWIVEKQVDLLTNLSAYRISTTELERLEELYRTRQLSKERTLSTLETAYLYGIICYFKDADPPTYSSLTDSKLSETP